MTNQDSHNAYVLATVAAELADTVTGNGFDVEQAETTIERFDPPKDMPHAMMAVKRKSITIVLVSRHISRPSK